MLVLGQLLALDRESDATEYIRYDNHQARSWRRGVLHAASGEIVMKNCVQFMWRSKDLRHGRNTTEGLAELKY